MLSVHFSSHDGVFVGGVVSVYETVSLSSQSTFPRLAACLLKVRWLSTGLCLCSQYTFPRLMA